MYSSWRRPESETESPHVSLWLLYWDSKLSQSPVQWVSGCPEMRENTKHKRSLGRSFKRVTASQKYIFGQLWFRSPPRGWVWYELFSEKEGRGMTWGSVSDTPGHSQASRLHRQSLGSVAFKRRKREKCYWVSLVNSGGSRPVLKKRGARLEPAFLLEGHIQPGKKRQILHSYKG